MGGSALTERKRKSEGEEKERERKNERERKEKGGGGDRKRVDLCGDGKSPQVIQDYYKAYSHFIVSLVMLAVNIKILA